MTKKHSKKTLELRKHTIFGRWGVSQIHEKKNECWSLFHIPLPLVTNWLIRPHLGSSHKIHHSQKIHGSLVLSDNKNYTLKACPLYDGPSFWKDMRTKGLGGRLELDLYEYMQTLVKKVISEPSGAALQNLQQTMMWGTPLPILQIFSMAYIGFFSGWIASGIQCSDQSPERAWSWCQVTTPGIHSRHHRE